MIFFELFLFNQKIRKSLFPNRKLEKKRKEKKTKKKKEKENKESKSDNFEWEFLPVGRGGARLTKGTNLVVR